MGKELCSSHGKGDRMTWLNRLWFVVCVLGLGASACGQLTFSLTDLGSLPGNLGSAAYAINNNGQIVGEANVGSTQHAFLYSNGVMSDLGILRGFQQSVGTAINASGQVAGYDWTSNYLDDEAFLFNGSSTLPLGWIGTCVFNQGCYSYAYSMDSVGHVVGCTAVGYPRHPQAFLWDGTSMQGLLSAAGTDTCALGTNGSQIVGYSDPSGWNLPHAIVWSSKFPTDLPALSQTVGSSANAINVNQLIVGYSTASDGWWHAVSWSNGRITDLGTLGGYAQALAVSSDGWIVGDSQDSQGNDNGFLVANRCGMQNLTAMLDSSGTGWTLATARGINDKHWIVGWGFAPDGFGHAYLLKPKGKQLCF
jgi:probable HAF family extracellular repeat protein